MEIWAEIGERGTAKTGWAELQSGAPGEVREAFARAAGCARDENRFETVDKAEWEKFERRLRKATGSWPDSVRHHAPRHTIVQRRIIAEIAHELPEHERARSVREWCQRTLGKKGVDYYAVIHQPERGNDARNWHAHIVFSQIRTRELATEPGLPRRTEWAQKLASGGSEGVRIVRELRHEWASCQNEALERTGESKRYDPRSYREQGIERRPGHHLGPGRAALERREEMLETLETRIEPGCTEQQAALIVCDGLERIGAPAIWIREWRKAAGTQDDTDEDHREQDKDQQREAALRDILEQARQLGAREVWEVWHRSRRVREEMKRWRQQDRKFAREIEGLVAIETARRRVATRRGREALRSATEGNWQGALRWWNDEQIRSRWTQEQQRTIWKGIESAKEREEMAAPKRATVGMGR